jgi:hypothetical protein
MVNLVDGQDRGGGVIERRREFLGCDVDDDPEDEVGSCLIVRSSPTQTNRLKTSVDRLVPPGRS